MAAAGRGSGRRAGEPEAVPVDAVFGSGLRGLTPVSFAPAGRLRELRLSFSRARDGWIPTPGGEEDEDPAGGPGQSRSQRRLHRLPRHRARLGRQRPLRSAPRRARRHLRTLPRFGPRPCGGPIGRRAGRRVRRGGSRSRLPSGAALPEGTGRVLRAVPPPAHRLRAAGDPPPRSRARPPRRRQPDDERLLPGVPARRRHHLRRVPRSAPGRARLARTDAGGVLPLSPGPGRPPPADGDHRRRRLRRVPPAHRERGVPRHPVHRPLDPAARRPADARFAGGGAPNSPGSRTSTRGASPRSTRRRRPPGCAPDSPSCCTSAAAGPRRRRCSGKRSNSAPTTKRA